MLASHPPLNASDLRLHQFFALHRPLVLSQPAAALFDTSSTLVLGPTNTQVPPSTGAAPVPTTLDNPLETTPEADADTARLLARTLAMNAVNSSVSWDDTLRRLGLNPAEGRAAENAALEGLAVKLDSTQRKRRKKMKKHKCASFTSFFFSLGADHYFRFRLKKRRRVRAVSLHSSLNLSHLTAFQLQRSQRLKIGR